MPRNMFIAALCLLAGGGLFFVFQGQSAQADSCKGAAAMASERCSEGLSSKKVSPDPRSLKPAGRGPERNKNLCRGPLRQDHGIKGVCEMGVAESKAKLSLALIGDSHAAQWRPAISAIAKQRSWRVFSLTASACDYISGNQFKRGEGERWRDCKRFRSRVPGFLKAHPEISTVLFSSVSQAAPEAVFGYQKAWAQMPGSVTRVGVIRDNPRAYPDAHACIIKAKSQGRSPALGCSLPRSEALKKDSQLIAAQESPGAAAIDLSDYFCDKRNCYPVIGGVLVYQDGNHQTAQFNRTLAPFLLEEILSAWPDV